MKKFINRNYFWASIFVEQLLQFDIKHVCISPGSRNTPLTLAFANNKKVKKYIHVDERSSGFFALGVAKKINKPVVLVTTSGTAIAGFAVAGASQLPEKSVALAILQILRNIPLAAIGDSV